MENLRNRRRIKPVKSDDPETMYRLQKTSTFVGFETFDKFDCFASQNEILTFENQ